MMETYLERLDILLRAKNGESMRCVLVGQRVQMLKDNLL